MKRARNTKFTRLVAALPALFLAFIIAGAPGPSRADGFGGYASPEEYGWSLYYKYHPAKKHFDPYPFSGPVIRSGQDIPVCDAARNPEAYLYKRDMKYIFHGKDGWLFRSSDFRTDFTASPQTLDYFNLLNQALAAKGQTLIVAFQPPRGVLEKNHMDPAAMPKGYNPEPAKNGYEVFLKQLEDKGIATVDLANISGNFDYFPKGDYHWSPEGADFSARQIAGEIKKLTGYRDLDKHDFMIVPNGTAKYPTRGALENFIQDTCKINIEMTTGPVWTTEEAASGASKKENIFGDNSYPGVTVIGTSNSAEDDKFGFVGSLKRYLKTDVYNAALEGGGFGQSAYRYFASNEYQTYPPKFVIWEFSSEHQYNSEESLLGFRQMIPATYGACAEEEALASTSSDIVSPETGILDQMKHKVLKNTYLYMEVNDPAERSVKVDILYANGDADQVDLTRSTRTGNNGKYYLDLNTESGQPILFMHLLTDTPKGRINARLCRYPVNIASR